MNNENESSVFQQGAVPFAVILNRGPAAWRNLLIEKLEERACGAWVDGQIAMQQEKWLI
jgi:hypothetical protein